MLNESNALLRQAIDQHYSTSAPAIKQHVIRSLMQMPKAIDYPGFPRDYNVPHPLVFGQQAWKPELIEVVPLLRRYDAQVRELKVTPRHRHHHWPSRYREPEAVFEQVHEEIMRDLLERIRSGRLDNA